MKGAIGGFDTRATLPRATVDGLKAGVFQRRDADGRAASWGKDETFVLWDKSTVKKSLNLGWSPLSSL